MSAARQQARGMGRPAGLGQWLFAVGVALGLHAGVVGMLLIPGGEAASQESFGANAIEIGIENVAPSFDATDAPEAADAAPEATSAIAAAAPPAREEAAPEQAAPSLQAEQPVAEAPPDREERPEKERAEASQMAAVATPSTAAPSRVAERESTQSAATSIGSSLEAQRARAAWRRGLVAHIERQKRYPAGTERPVDIVVSFRIDHKGRLIALDIVKGSGDARYDQAALDMVRRADPMPSPPTGMSEQNLSFRLPISFRSGG
jgi:TonB family protein